MTTLRLEESSHRAGSYRWAEQALFQVLGSWVAGAGPAEVKLMLDRHSQHAAWRSQQWWDRLPVVADVDRDALCAPPRGVAGALVDALSGLAGPVARLAGAYRFALPRLWVAYDRYTDALSPVSDSSTLRTLGVVSSDLAADWREGEAALQGLLAAGAVEAAAAAVAGLERLLLAVPAGS